MILAGFKVSSEGYKMDPARLEAIREFEQQTTPEMVGPLHITGGICILPTEGSAGATTGTPEEEPL